MAIDFLIVGGIGGRSWVCEPGGPPALRLPRPRRV